MIWERQSLLFLLFLAFSTSVFCADKCALSDGTKLQMDSKGDISLIQSPNTVLLKINDEELWISEKCFERMSCGIAHLSLSVSHGAVSIGCSK